MQAEPTPGIANLITKPQMKRKKFATSKALNRLLSVSIQSSRLKTFSQSVDSFLDSLFLLREFMLYYVCKLEEFRAV